METPIDREVAEIFTLVDNLLRKLRKKRNSIQKTSQLLAQYCLENPLTSYDTWYVLMMLRTMSEMPAKTRRQISETLAELSAWMMQKRRDSINE